MTKEYEYNTYEEAMKAVKTSIFSIKYFRPDLQPSEIALMAVRYNGLNLEQVPAHLQTQEVIEAALKQNPDAKYFIKIKVLIMEALGEALGE